MAKTLKRGPKGIVFERISVYRAHKKQIRRKPRILNPAASQIKAAGYVPKKPLSAEEYSKLKKALFKEMCLTADAGKVNAHAHILSFEKPGASQNVLENAKSMLKTRGFRETPENISHLCGTPLCRDMAKPAEKLLKDKKIEVTPQNIRFFSDMLSRGNAGKAEQFLIKKGMEVTPQNLWNISHALLFGNEKLAEKKLGELKMARTPQNIRALSIVLNRKNLEEAKQKLKNEGIRITPQNLHMMSDLLCSRNVEAAKQKLGELGMKPNLRNLHVFESLLSSARAPELEKAVWRSARRKAAKRN